MSDFCFIKYYNNNVIPLHVIYYCMVFWILYCVVSYNMSL